jgi:hypothetical protein
MSNPLGDFYDTLSRISNENITLRNKYFKKMLTSVPNDDRLEAIEKLILVRHDIMNKSNFVSMDEVDKLMK